MTQSNGSRVELSIESRGAGHDVATITIDHGAKLNILNTESMGQCIQHLDALRQRESLRVVVLRGAGTKAFIGGADIQEMANLTPDTARDFITRLHTVCEGIRGLPVPVIARIQGYCMGAGLEVAAACDLRVAAEGSTFGMPEVRVGIPSVIEACLLPRLCGWGKARELVLTGDMIPSAEALQCGLVERVVHPKALDEAVDAWVNAIVEAGPRAIRAQKALIRRWERLSHDAAIEAGIDAFADAYTTDEPTTMMNAFLERKKPKTS